MPSSGNTSSKIRGPQNGNSIGECLEGQTWTQVEGNVTFDWSISGYPSLHVFVWLGVDYTLRALVYLSVMHVWLLLFIGDVDMLITLIDSLTYFLLYDYLAFLDMYILIFVYLIHLDMIDSICCIVFCLSQHIVHSAIYLSCLSYLYLTCV